MTRIVRRAGPAQAARAHGKPLRAQIRKHKIIMETITQEKKKLRSVISFEAKAPAGYTFIPAGNPKFTSACKEICRKDGLKVFTVTTTPHQSTHNLSQQVHRIGYHFPSVVVATVCMERGVFLSSGGKVMPYRHMPSHGPALDPSHERRPDSEVSQNTINNEARDAIKDLFPNIPDKDLNQIIKTAFRKGKRKVGTAIELPLARRAQLAVVAHIRHIYTEYDRLLRLVSFQEARAAVEEPCLAKLVQWRGDDESGETVLEDVFREVIVISDDEDEDETSDDNGLLEGERDCSVEIISSNPVISTQPLQYGAIPNSNHALITEISEDDGVSSVRFLSDHPRKRKSGEKKKIDRRGFSRYQAWDRARDRYRDTLNMPGPSTLDQPADRHTECRPMPIAAQAQAYEAKPADPFSPSFPRQSQKLPSLHPSRSQPQFSRRTEAPKIIRFSDGSVFERADTVTGPGYSRPEDGPNYGPPLHPTRGFIPAEQVRYPPSMDKPYTTPLEMASHESQYRANLTTRGHYPKEQSSLRPSESSLPLPRKRGPNGNLVEGVYPQQPPLEDLSGRLSGIDIDGIRYQIPPKRSKVLVHASIENPELYSPMENTKLRYNSLSHHPGPRRGNEPYTSGFENKSPLIPNTAGPQSRLTIAGRGSSPERRPLMASRPENSSREDESTNDFIDYQRPVPTRQVDQPLRVFRTKPSLLAPDETPYGTRSENYIRPKQSPHGSQLRYSAIGSDAPASREYQFQKPDPVRSIMIHSSPERRLPMLHQDTRSPRIYSHDFVRPILIPKANMSSTHLSHAASDIPLDEKFQAPQNQMNSDRVTTNRKIQGYHSRRSLSPKNNQYASQTAVPAPQSTYMAKPAPQGYPPAQERAYRDRGQEFSHHDSILSRNRAQNEPESFHRYSDTNQRPENFHGMTPQYPNRAVLPGTMLIRER